jgi:hypothetical protein
MLNFNRTASAEALAWAVPAEALAKEGKPF